MKDKCELCGSLNVINSRSKGYNVCNNFTVCKDCIINIRVKFIEFRFKMWEMIENLGVGRSID